MALIDEVDIKMSYDGDLLLDENGDLALSQGFDWLTREVNKRLRSTASDWADYPNIAADLDSFIGKLNTRKTATEIRENIVKALQNEPLTTSAINVKIVPISYDAIMCIVSYIDRDTLVEISRFVYDFNNGVAQPIEEEDVETHQAIETHRKPENIYVDRMHKSGVLP